MYTQIKTCTRFYAAAVLLAVFAANAPRLAAQTAMSGPVIMIDGNPCPKEQIDNLVLDWNEKAAGFLQDFQNELRTYVTRCERLLSGFSTMPSFESGDLLALFEQVAESTADYQDRVSLMRQFFWELVADAGIAPNTPVLVLGEARFDVLFPVPPLVSIDGRLYPAAAVSMIQEAMAQAGAAQGKLLYSELEKMLTAICNARQANSMDMAKWVTGWGNYITRPVKELSGRWAAEYEKEFAVRINKGVDVDAPERMLVTSWDKAEILLAGYFNILAVCEIPETPNMDENTAYQEMDMNEFFAPFTLLDSIVDAGDILGYDTSGWRTEANDRIGGAINVGFVVADVAVFIATKCNPVTGIIEAAFHGLEAGWHAFTKGKKEQRLAANIRSALMEDRDKILAALQSCIVL